MKTATIDQIMAWGPCPEYTREHVEKLFAGRNALTATDIVNLPIPTGEKNWALLHFLNEKQIHDLDHDFSDSAKNPCLFAIEVQQCAHLRGEINDEELDAAYDAAMVAEKEWYMERIMEMLGEENHAIEEHGLVR